MGNEVTVKDSALPALSDAEMAAWGTPNLKSSDIIIPKILVMQGMSELVTEGKATMGDFRDSLSGEKLGTIVEPIEVIPFHCEKFWDIMEQDEEGNWKWCQTIPLNEVPGSEGYNDDLGWEGKNADGEDIRRVRRMNFYVLLKKEIEEGTAMPYIFSFKSTSYREGKKLWSQMYFRNLRAKLPPCGFSILLGGIRTKNDKGTFIVPNYQLGTKIDRTAYAECKNWFSLIQKGGVKVDDSDLTAEAAQTVEAADDTGAF